MSTHINPLPVLFRVTKRDPFKEVTAVFPTEPGDAAWQTFRVYVRVGQHGTGTRGWYADTHAATPEECAPLLAELRSIYETGPDAVTLRVIKRFTRAHDEIRKRKTREDR